MLLLNVFSCLMIISLLLMIVKLVLIYWFIFSTLTVEAVRSTIKYILRSAAVRILLLPSADLRVLRELRLTVINVEFCWIVWHYLWLHLLDFIFLHSIRIIEFLEFVFRNFYLLLLYFVVLMSIWSTTTRISCVRGSLLNGWSVVDSIDKLPTLCDWLVDWSYDQLLAIRTDDCLVVVVVFYFLMIVNL